MITGEQVRAARKLLGWSQEDLAGHAGMSDYTVGTFERGLRPSENTVTVLQRALESAGVEFPEGEPVRLRKP